MVRDLFLLFIILLNHLYITLRIRSLLDVFAVVSIANYVPVSGGGGGHGFKFESHFFRLKKVHYLQTAKMIPFILCFDRGLHIIVSFIQAMHQFINLAFG